jgi:hypothetical protein
MSAQSPEVDSRAAAKNAKIELTKQMREYLVSVVHKEGRWEKIGSTTVMCVPDHFGLCIRYYTPFQKRRSPANAGKQFGYQLEVLKRHSLLLSLIWNEGGAPYVETFCSSRYDKYLIPPVVRKTADKSKQVAVAS